MGMPLLQVDQVRIAYGKQVVIKDLSMKMLSGEIFSLVGESGSGKSTLGRAIMGLLPCCGGEIRLDGDVISRKMNRKRRKALIPKLQMVFQDPAASLNQRATVSYILEEGLVNLGVPKEERRERVAAILQQVGLHSGVLSRYPHQFSGGQRQRIGFARALVMEPKMVVADEPISALDVSVRAQVLNLMDRFRREKGTAFLFIAHDLSVVRHISQRIGVICQGQLVEVGSAQRIFEEPQHPYTKSLLSAVPIPDPILERRRVAVGWDGVVDGQLSQVAEDHWVRI